MGFIWLLSSRLLLINSSNESSNLYACSLARSSVESNTSAAMRPSVASAPLNRDSTSTTKDRAARQIHPRACNGHLSAVSHLEHGRFALIHNCVHLQSGGAHQQVPCVGTRAITLDTRMGSLAPPRLISSHINRSNSGKHT